ncbi:MAG: SoxY-related AACIE arm protein [Burkholderiales bacterium]
MATRRQLLKTSAGLAGALCLRPAQATPEELSAAITAFASGGTLRGGRVKLDVAPLVENGNVVPITVSVESPMSATDHVKAIAVFNERNPQRDVVVFHLGPRAGRATVATRIRLATSQQLVAVAQMNDGSCWTHTVDVIVTLAACVES